MGRAGLEFQRAGPKMFRLYTPRRTTSDKCVNSHTAVSAAAQAAAVTDSPPRCLFLL